MATFRTTAGYHVDSHERLARLETRLGRVAPPRLRDDFELYDQHAADPQDAQVGIYFGIRQ